MGPGCLVRFLRSLRSVEMTRGRAVIIGGSDGWVEGIVGGQKALPEIEALSLESIAEEEEELNE